MAKVRSPNYPSIDLHSAIAAVAPVYKAEGRNTVPKEIIAKHLGYSSINGRSLSMIGALRGYGLIEGRGEENRVSEDALILLNAPTTSPDYAAALQRCAYRPTLFSELKGQFPQGASSENLRYSLVKRQFTPEAAAKAVETYASNVLLLHEVNADTAQPPAPLETFKEPPVVPLFEGITPQKQERVMAVQPGERELVTGGLSGDARFRLIVSGTVGSKELARLIKKLEMEKEIAEEAEHEAAKAALGLPPKGDVFN
ncbi:MAG: hypothetical protein KIT25_22175 [Enhydrobacter sp.]|nr:MAG: hypothetical protein KIT25_22175 [Enhydrobacter sp.]